jgi:hypothetical protein
MITSSSARSEVAPRKRDHHRREFQAKTRQPHDTDDDARQPHRPWTRRPRCARPVPAPRSVRSSPAPTERDEPVQRLAARARRSQSARASGGGDDRHDGVEADAHGRVSRHQQRHQHHQQGQEEMPATRPARLRTLGSSSALKPVRPLLDRGDVHQEVDRTEIENGRERSKPARYPRRERCVNSLIRNAPAPISGGMICPPVDAAASIPPA